MKQFKIIAATSVVIFTLFSSFSGAIAWFQSNRNQKTNAADFYVEAIDTSIQSIKLYSYFGETINEDTVCYTFDPNYTSIYSNGEFDDDAPLVSLNPYSMDKPNHPVLIVYEINGLRTRIDLSTDYCYLGASQDFIATKTETKSELEGLANKQANAYYEVSHDETNGGKTTLYQYVNSGFVNMTVDTYASLNSVKTAGNNNKYFRVSSDETRSGVASMYQYKHVKSDFDLAWIDLGVNDGTPQHKETNPLSSAVTFYSFTNNDFALNPTYHMVNQETFNEETQDYSYSIKSSLQCIAINKSSLNDANKTHSFTNFTGPETYDYYQEINLYDDQTDNVTYVGIIVDYDQLSLEYIFSRSLGHDALNYGLTFECDWITKF